MTHLQAVVKQIGSESDPQYIVQAVDEEGHVLAEAHKLEYASPTRTLSGIEHGRLILKGWAARSGHTIQETDQERTEREQREAAIAAREAAEAEAAAREEAEQEARRASMRAWMESPDYAAFQAYDEQVSALAHTPEEHARHTEEEAKQWTEPPESSQAYAQQYDDDPDNDEEE